MKEIALDLGIKINSEIEDGALETEVKPEKIDKSLGQTITVRMFGGHGSMGDVEIFNEFGIIGKTIILTSENKRTEDMKFYRVDFNEMKQKTIIDFDGCEREMTYEDSVLYTYFSEQKILMIIFKEPYKPKSKEKIPLTDDIFVGFKLLTFPDLFINKYGKKLWDDTRDKILNHKLVVLDCHKKTGEPIITPQTKKIKSAPNWMKKSENPFFFRGSGHNSEDKYKTEVVNGIHMYPQNIWIDGKYIVNQLNLVEEVKIKNSI